MLLQPLRSCCASARHETWALAPGNRGQLSEERELVRNLSALPGFATTPAAAPTGCPRARLIPLFSRVGVLADTAKLLDALRPPPELISQLERTGSFTWHTVPRPTRQATPGSGTPVTETGLASAVSLSPSEWKPSRRPPPSAQNGSAVGTGSPEKSSLHSKCTRTSVWDRGCHRAGVGGAVLEKSHRLARDTARGDSFCLSVCFGEV